MQIQKLRPQELTKLVGKPGTLYYTDIDGVVTHYLWNAGAFNPAAGFTTEQVPALRAVVSGDGNLAVPGLVRCPPSSAQGIRAAVAAALAGVSDVMLVGQGDSIGNGTGITYGRDHWMTRAAQRMAARTGLTVGAGWEPLSPMPVGTSKANTYATVGAGWEVFSQAWMFGCAEVTANAGTSTSVDIAFTETIDSIDILLHAGGGNTGPCIYSWNATGIGGATTVAQTSPNGAFYFQKVSIPAPSRGVHTLHLWQSGSGTKSYYTAACPRDSTVRKIRPFASGISGKTLYDLRTAWDGAGPAQALAAMGCHLFVAQIGTNDQIQQPGYTSGAAFVAHLDALRTKVLSAQPKTSFMWLGPSNSENSGTFSVPVTDYVSSVLGWAATTDAIVGALNQRWGTYAAGNALGMFDDGLHPGPLGSADMGAVPGSVVG